MGHRGAFQGNLGIDLGTIGGRPDPEEQLRIQERQQHLALQQAQLAEAQQNAQQRQMAYNVSRVIGQVIAQPQQRTAQLPGNVTFQAPQPGALLAPQAPAQDFVYPAQAKYQTVPTLTEAMQNPAIQTLPPEGKVMAYEYLRGRVAESPQVPEDIAHEQEVRKLIAAVPGVTRADAEYAVMAPKVQPVKDLMEMQAERRVRELQKNNQIIDPTTGLPVNLNTFEGLSAAANRAISEGAPKIAAQWEKQAQITKQILERQKSERLRERAAPIIARARAMLDSNAPIAGRVMTDTERDRLATAINALDANPSDQNFRAVEGVYRDIQKSNEFAQSEQRRAQALKDREARWAKESQKIDAQIAKWRQAGPGGDAETARELAQSRITVQNKIGDAYREKSLLSDSTRAAAFGLTPDQIRQKQAELDDEITHQQGILTKIQQAQLKRLQPVLPATQVPAGGLDPSLQKYLK